VVALQNQDAVERSHQDIVDLVLLARIPRHHSHENKYENDNFVGM
jgi:hypothetical protein